MTKADTKCKPSKNRKQNDTKRIGDSNGGLSWFGLKPKTSVGFRVVVVRLGGVMAMKDFSRLADTLLSAKNWLDNAEE